MARMISLIVLAVLVIIFGVLFYQVMAGFLLPMFIAVLLAIIFQPIYQQIVRSCGGRRRLAAGLTTVAIVLIVMVPLLGVVAHATSDALTMLGTGEGLRIDERQFEQFIERTNEWSPVPISAQEVHQQIDKNSRQLLQQVALATPATIGNVLVGLFVTVFSLYYFLADGREMIRTIVRLFPLRDDYQMQLLAEFESVARAVITATVVSALLQGMFGGLGFYFAGLGSIFLLIFLTMLTSMIPLIGSSPVWFGCGAWLYFHDRPLTALFLVVYGLAVMITIDNVVRPIILHGRSKLHPLLALLSVLGGIQVLGPIGLFIGPMAVAFLQAGLNMFHTELVALEKGKAKK